MQVFETMIIVKIPKVKNEDLMFQKLYIYYLISFCNGLQYWVLLPFHFWVQFREVDLYSKGHKIGSDRARTGIQISDGKVDTLVIY